MALREGPRTCRALRLGPPLVGSDPSASALLLLLGWSRACVRSAYSPAQWRAQLAETEQGRTAAWQLPPSPPAGLYKLSPCPPARPPRRARLRAASTARRAWHPCYPTRWRTPPALLAGAGNSGPRPLPGVRPEKIPTPNSLGAAVRCARGGAGGQGELLPGGPGWSTKETLPRAWLRPQYPTRNGAPRGPSDFRFATADVRPQRPLGTVDRLGGPQVGGQAGDQARVGWAAQL